MKYSEKGPEPDFFAEYKTRAAGKNGGGDVSYKRFKPKGEKKRLHEHIVNEQSALCCYCGKRITYNPAQADHNNCHIEHFTPLQNDPSKGLEYSNMFISCGPNNTKSIPDVCGKSKDAQLIDPSLIPSNSQSEKSFIYGLSLSLIHI